MDALEALADLVTLVGQLFDFLWVMIQDLFKIVDMLAQVLLQLPSLLQMFLPPGVAGIFMIAVSVTVIYRVSARD